MIFSCIFAKKKRPGLLVTWHEGIRFRESEESNYAPRLNSMNHKPADRQTILTKGAYHRSPSVHSGEHDRHTQILDRHMWYCTLYTTEVNITDTNGRQIKVLRQIQAFDIYKVRQIEVIYRHNCLTDTSIRQIQVFYRYKCLTHTNVRQIQESDRCKCLTDTSVRQIQAFDR